MQDESAVKIISRLGVDYSPAISSTKIFSAELEKLNAQLRALKVTAADMGRVAGTGMAQQIFGNKIIYDQYGRVLSVAGANTKEIEKATKTATKAAREHAKTVKDLSKQYSVLGSQFERRASWFFAGTAFFGSMAATGAAVRTIADVEMGVTQVARVMEDSAFIFKDYRDELLKLGVQYGQTFATVQDVALRFAQAGYGVRDSLKLTETALMALRSAELDAKNATESMIGIMAQWGLQAKDMPLLLDILNKTADDYTVTTQDLVDALLRSSGAAKIMGLSIQETIALLTVMREASGRTGREVGNAFNSILSYIQRPKAIETLSSLGIAVFADEARTQFRNVMDIFQDIAERWNESGDIFKDSFVKAAQDTELFNEELAIAMGLQDEYNKAVEEYNDLQKRDIAQSAAGVYRRNYFIALIERLSKAQEVLNNMIDAEGYSAKETARSLDTLSGQYDQLKAAAEQLAVAIGDAGLLNQLKEMVDGLKDVINWFNGLDPTLRNAIINFVEITAVLKVFNAIMKMAGIETANRLLSGWAISAAKASAATRVLASATTGLSIALTNLGRGLLAFFGGPWGLAFSIATAAYLTFRNSADASNAAMEESAKKALDTANDIQRLRDRYIELAEKTNLTSAEQEEFKDVTARLLDLVPSAVTGFDEMGNAITDVGTAAEASARKIALLKEEHEKFIQAKAAVAQSVLPELREQLKKQKEDYAALAEAIKYGPEFARGTLLRMPSGTFKAIDSLKTFFAESDEVHKKAIARLEEIGKSIAETTKQISDYENAIKAASGLESAPTGGVVKPRPKSTGYVGGVSDRGGAAKAATDAIREQIQALTDAISQLDLVNSQYEASLAKTGSLLSINASEYEYLTGKIEAGTATAQDYARAQELISVKIALLQQEQDQLHQTNEKYRADLVSLNSVLAEAQRQYEAFQAAGDTEHMKDAAQVVSQLQDKIQSLTSAIDQNSAKWWENQRAIMEAKRALSEEYFSSLTSWIQHMSAIGRLSVEQQIEYYRAIDKTTLALQSQWQVEEELYDLRRQSIQDAMDEVRDAYEERMKQIEDEIEAEEEATQAKIDQKEKRIQAIEDETNAQIEAIQRLIDALDVEDEQSDREEAERQHNKKLADLQEEYQYHTLRTGIEHQRRMAEILEEIAEEEHNWELKKQEWARQEQRKAYQQQIDALREQARARQDAIRQEINDIKKSSDNKKKELQRYYDDIQRLINDKTIDMLAMLSMADEQWYERGLEWMRRLAEGIRDGQRELPSGIRSFVGEARETARELPPAGSGMGETPPPAEPKMPVATFTAGNYINKNGTTYAWSRLIAAKLGLPVEWDEKEWLVKIGNRGFSPDFIQDDRAYLGLRRVGEAFGYDVRYDERTGTVSYFPKAHTGAFVAESGIAELLKGERVLSPQLTVSFDRLANVLANFPNIPERISLMQQGYGNLDRLADRIIAAIERRKGIHIERLFNAETVELADRTDMEILSRELARAVNMLQTARG